LFNAVTTVQTDKSKDLLYKHFLEIGQPIRWSTNSFSCNKLGYVWGNKLKHYCRSNDAVPSVWIDCTGQQRFCPTRKNVCFWCIFGRWIQTCF